MPLRPPVLDDRNYEQLLDEVLRRIRVHDPEWTDFNESDPGITLLELFAFLADALVWLLAERQRHRRLRRRRRLALVVGVVGAGLIAWRMTARGSPEDP